ncbi:M48 family metalloprotease [Prosthecobacter algae]
MHLSLRRWRKSQGAHWTERARLLWQARRAQFGVTLGIMFTIGAVWAFKFPEDDGRWWLLLPVIGLVLGGYPAAREIEPRYTFRVWLVHTVWTLIVQFGLVGIFLGLMFTMPKVLTWQDWVRAVLGIAAMAFIVSALWMPVMARLCRCKHPEEARLDRITEEATAISVVKPRHTWLSVSPVANAGALVYIQGLVVTTRLMEVLDDDEVRAVILHEMAHLRERLIVQVARLAGMLCWTILIFFHPVHHHFGSRGLLVLFGAMYGLQRLFTWFSRRLERVADEAAMQGAADSAIYAHALEKLYQVNQMPAVMRGRQLHPHLYDRMLQAGVTPDYPRPLPPGLMAWPGWVALLLPLVLGAGFYIYALGQ